MKITLIDKENAEAFASFMPHVTYKNDDDLLCIGAVDDDNRAAGAMAVRTGESGADIISLYVMPEYRRRGYGREMVNTLASLVSGTDLNRLSVHFVEDDTAMAFFDAMGFELVEDMAVKYAVLGDILEYGVFKKNVKSAKTDNVKTVSELDPAEKNVFATYMHKKGLRASGTFDPECSTVCLDGDKVTSVMLSHAEDGDATILWMDFRKSYQKELLKHMAAFYRYMKKDGRFDLTSKIYFAVMNDKFVETITKLTLDPGTVRKDAVYIYGAKIVGTGL